MQDYKENLGESDNKNFDNKKDDGRYKTLFEQINAAAFLMSFEGQILEVNHKSCELLGYEWNELLRLSLRDFLTSEIDWDQFKDEIASKGGIKKETECIAKNGSYIPVEISISLFMMSGKPVMFVLICDITDRKKAELKLKESENKYRGLFEYTTDGTLVLDARGDILDVNTKICEILDLTKDSFIGKNLFSMDLLTSTSLPIVVKQFEQLLSEKTAKSFTTEIKDKNGIILDVEISSFFLVRKDNEIDNFVLIIRDITDRKLNEKKHFMDNNLLMTLLDNIPDSIYFKDENNRFVLVNKSKAFHSNVSADDMIGKTDFDFLPDDQARKVFDDDESILRTGKPIIGKKERLIYPDGSEKWVSVTKIPRYNSDGDIIGTMGISRDITMQEKAIESLVKSEERYRTVFNNSSFAIILTDEDQRIISWNRIVEELFGMNHYELFMKSVDSLYPLDEWKKINSEYLFEIEYKKHFETKIIRKDNKIIDVDLSVNILKNSDGKILGSTQILRDISKRKEAESNLERKHELLMTLMNNIPDSIYFKDENNRFVLVNKAKAFHWNVSENDMIGKTDFDFLSPQQAKIAFDDDNTILRTKKPIVDKIEKITDSNGNERWFSVTKVPWFDNNSNVIGTMGISRDVTEWKKLKDMKKSLFTKD